MHKDIARNLKSNTEEDILVVSIYDDLGKILLGNRRGERSLSSKKTRIKIEKIY